MPRPISPLFALSARSSTAFATLQCRRSIHIRAIAPALRPQVWHNPSQSAVQASKRWEIQRIQHASTSTTPAKKTSQGSTAAAPPAATTKTKVPGKPVLKPPAPGVLGSKTSTRPNPRAKENLNPPSFTYPPELDIPDRQPDQNWVKYIWTVGRKYMTFYKQGISNVRETAKLAKTLRKKAQETPDRDMSEVLTRAEWQIVRRSKNDVRRLPIFGFLALVLGEWLALFAVFLTPVIPEVCRIPKQVESKRRKLEETRSRITQHVVMRASRMMRKEPPPMKPQTIRVPKDGSMDQTPRLVAVARMQAATIHNMTIFELCLFAARMDCYPRIFTWTPFVPPKWLLQRKIRRRFAYTNKDDELIERDGGWAALGMLELQRACEERSFSVLGKKEEELRKSLDHVEIVRRKI